MAILDLHADGDLRYLRNLYIGCASYLRFRLRFRRSKAGHCIWSCHRSRRVVVFLTANGLVSLLVGRALQGIAVGITTGAAGALLVDLDVDGERAPFVASTMPGVGLALGALGAALSLSMVGTNAIHLVDSRGRLRHGYNIADLDSQTGVVRSGVLSSLRPELRIMGARQTFLIAVPCFIGVWALSGFYLSLGPSLVSHLFKSGT